MNVRTVLLSLALLAVLSIGLFCMTGCSNHMTCCSPQQQAPAQQSSYYGENRSWPTESGHEEIGSYGTENGYSPEQSRD